MKKSFDTVEVKSYDEDGQWDWRKDMGVPPEKIYNVVITRPDGKKFDSYKKTLSPNSWKIVEEQHTVQLQLLKTIWKLFEDRYDLLIRTSTKNTDKRHEFIFKINEDKVILKKIKTRIKNLIKSSGLSIVMEEQKRDYLFSDKFYKI